MDANATNTLRKYRWYWAWEDEKEEIWLREMSNQGWHLNRVDFPGWYNFIKGEPKDYAYRLDWAADGKKSADYFQLFKDAGWDYLGEMNSWQYFRKEAVNGLAPEIFTDYDSKVYKYRRIIGILVIFVPIILISFINLSDMNHAWAQGLQIFFGLMLVFYAYLITMLLLRINALKKL